MLVLRCTICLMTSCCSLLLGPLLNLLIDILLLSAGKVLVYTVLCLAALAALL